MICTFVFMDHPLTVYLRARAETAYAFGKRIGYSHSTISRLISGQRCSASLAKAVEQGTGGEVRKSFLRPDLWDPPAPASQPRVVHG